MGTDMNAKNPSNALGKEQARVLAEALPYIHAYHGKTFVIDYARRSAGQPTAWNSLGRDLALLSLVGLRLVVVHFAKGFLPVVRPLGTAPDGQVCPMEGDLVAAAIAAQLKAAKLIVMRDSAGLSDNNGRLIHRLSAAEAETLDAGNVHLARALRSGVSAVHVVDARRPEVLLLEILTCESRGTLILPDGIAEVIEQSVQYLAPGNKGNERESC